MDLILYGTSYKTAPVELREGCKFSLNEIEALLSMLVEQDGVHETLVLSTCNRTEIYAVCEKDLDKKVLRKVLSGSKDISELISDEHFYFLRNFDVVKHLFRVTAGLESQMVGENQIKGQVKDAYHLSCKAGTNGAYLNKLLHMAFRSAKDVKTRTNLGTGSVSIAAAAAQLAFNIYEDLSGKNVLLIGAGGTGELVAKYLIERGVGSLKIANRTEESAKELAIAYGGEVVSFGSIVDEFFKNDIVISATSSSDHIITKDMIAKKAEENRSKKIMVIDIAVPRDIDPAISIYDNIYLYDIDDLETVVKKNFEQRMNEIPHAEKIIDSQVAEYTKWFSEKVNDDNCS